MIGLNLNTPTPYVDDKAVEQTMARNPGMDRLTAYRQEQARQIVLAMRPAGFGLASVIR